MGSLEKINLRKLLLPKTGSSKVKVLKKRLNATGEYKHSSLSSVEIFNLISTIPESGWDCIPSRYDTEICKILWQSFDAKDPLANNRSFLYWFMEARVRQSLLLSKHLVRGLAWHWPAYDEQLIDDLETYISSDVSWPSASWQRQTIGKAMQGEELKLMVAALWEGLPSEKMLLVKKLWRELLTKVGQQLHEQSNNSLASVRALTKEGFDSNGKLYWPDLSVELLNCLLPPLKGRISSPESLLLKNVVLTAFGRPDQGVWLKASKEAAFVGQQWIATLRFERFFTFVEKYHASSGDKTAQRHWDDRKKFWLSVLDMGVDEVQLALASNLRSRLTNSDRNLLRPAFLITSGTQFSNDHAALVVKIKGMTMVEWSHNATSRVWYPGNHAAPVCNKSQYSADKMNDNADKKIFHRGDWQTKYASLIYSKTGLWLRRDSR